VTAGKGHGVSSFTLFNGEVNSQVDNAVSAVGKIIHDV
jgi:hypothetical protein